MTILDPTRTRLSPHFMLSDFMGCYSVFSKGFRNVFDMEAPDPRLENARALCHQALEPILANAGPISISYGFISPELSRKIVTYQDPNKPSHHRWDLGAAADICVHDWVQTIAPGAKDTTGSPIEFALTHLQDLPISRLITYSESPYFCVAVSAEEVERGQPRMAWYENRYGGKPKVKPLFRKLHSERQRAENLAVIQAHGLPYEWRGTGYPTHHGGGIRQHQHTRTSQYTMLSDWLFDEEFVRTGVRNDPMVGNAQVREAFRIAGYAYDKIIKATGVPRMSIVSAYTSHTAPGRWINGRDWRGEDICFELVPPEYQTPTDAMARCMMWPAMFEIMNIEVDDDRLHVTVSRENVKNSEGFAQACGAEARKTSVRVRRR